MRCRRCRSSRYAAARSFSAARPRCGIPTFAVLLAYLPQPRRPNAPRKGLQCAFWGTQPFFRVCVCVSRGGQVADLEAQLRERAAEAEEARAVAEEATAKLEAVRGYTAANVEVRRSRGPSGCGVSRCGSGCA